MERNNLIKERKRMIKLKFIVEFQNNREVERVCERFYRGIYDYMYKDEFDNILVVIKKNVYKITNEDKWTGKKLGPLLSKEEIK